MHNSQQKSSSKKNGKHLRQSPEFGDRFNNPSTLLASKFGEITQRNMQTTSRQLERGKHKNHGDNTEYIRNLYKKYLGKQNTNNSERKPKTDMKDQKTEKTLITETCKQKLTYPAQCRTVNALTESTQQTNKPHKKKGNQAFQHQINACMGFYEQIKDKQCLELVGDSRCSLVRAMKIINSIRKQYR